MAANAMQYPFPAGAAPTALLSAELRTMPGYLPDQGQDVVVVSWAAIPHIAEDRLAPFDRWMAQILPAYEQRETPGIPASMPVLQRLARAYEAMMLLADMPENRAKCIFQAKGRLPVRLLLISCCAADVAGRCFHWLLDALDVSLKGAPVESVQARFADLLALAAAKAPSGTNTQYFLKAADEAGIPYRRVWRNVFQFGWGARARRLDSSFTDETPFIAAQLSKHKRATAAILRSAGVPVPVHSVPRDADHAVVVAERIGYPVVVKPVDQDGGRGVAAGLRTAEAVRKAYAVAADLSSEVLVEKHFEGNDYRLQVFQGEVFWATHRVPGGVTGDGARTVQQLLADTNAHPLRGEPGSNALLKRIAFDEEARELLGEQSLALNSVPDAGRFVRLRRASNVASGGIPVPALDKAHPDNLALAVRATRALGLDLAGVDLLIPDIARSWRETGAAICEVNGQPQLSPQLPAELLKRMLPQGGRIPVVLVVGEGQEAVHQAVAGCLAGFGTVGVAAPTQVTVNGEVICQESTDTYRGGLMLLADPRVDAAVIAVCDTRVLETGLPVDLYDVLVLAGGPPAGGRSEDWLAWHVLASTLQRMCRGTVVLNTGCGGWTAAVPRLDPDKLRKTDADHLHEAVCNYFEECQK